MRICPECGAEYADTENFCHDCGKKLKQQKAVREESHEELREQVEKLTSRLSDMEKESESRHREAAAASNSGLLKITGKLGILERQISKQPEPAANEDLMTVMGQMGELEKRIGDVEDAVSDMDEEPSELEDRVKALEKQVERTGKDAMRIVKAKAAPEGDILDVVEGLGDLEARVEKMEDRLGSFSDEADTSVTEKRLKLLEKKVGQVESGMKSFVSIVKESEGPPGSAGSRFQDFAKLSDLSDIREAMASADERVKELRDEVGRQAAKTEKVAKSKPPVPEKLDKMISEIDARVDEKLRPLEGLREKAMVIAGLALEQQERLKELKSGATGMMNRRAEQMEAGVAKQLDQMRARMDSASAANTASIDGLKAKAEGDISAINESLSKIEEFENRLSGEFESLRESAASKHDIEQLREAAESQNARLSTFKQLLASHTKALDDMSQLKAEVQSEQEHALDEMNSRTDEVMQEIRSQGNGIITDMERKMNDTVSAGLRSINEAKARMEGEMKLVLESLSRSEGFEKSVGQELGRIRAEIGRLDEKVKEAVAEEKGTLDRAISSELARLQKISREAEQKLGIMKDSWDRSMKESVRKNSEEFAKLRDFYAESMEKLDGMEKNMKAMVDNAVKDVVRRTSEDARTAASMRKEFESALREMKTTNRDSQEKLAMVKDFISNMETRFSTEIEALDRRVDGVSKTQRRLELDSLTPGKKGRQPIKKEDTD